MNQEAKTVPAAVAANPLPTKAAKAPTDVELAKARVRAAAAQIDPLRPVRDHPLISTGVAFAGGMVLGGLPVGLGGIGALTKFTLKTLLPHLIPLITSGAGIASSVAATTAASKAKAAADDTADTSAGS